MEKSWILPVPPEQPIGVRGKPEEVVLLADVLHGPAVDRALAVDELVLRVVELARDAVQAFVDAEVDVVTTVVVDGAQQSLDGVDVSTLRRADVVVVGDVQASPDLAPARLHLVDPRLRLHPRRLGGALELQAVLVRPGEMEHLLAAQPVVPGYEVGGNGVVRVADVGNVVRVVDRRGDVEDVSAHGAGHGSRGVRAVSPGVVTTPVG